MCEKLSIIPTLTMAFLFGFFQAAMPLISYFAGLNFMGIIKKSDHWIAFGLLALIGGKMLFEGIRKQDTECEPEIHPFSFLNLFLWQ